MTGATNGQCHGIGELERRITDDLHGHSRLAPERDGWEAILDRIEHRGRVRQRRRAAASGLVLVGMVGSLVVLAGADDTRVSTTPATPAAGAPAAAAATAAGHLPRLVLDVPGFEVTNASATGATPPFPDLGRLLVYTSPGDGLLGPGPVLFARLVPAGAAYGIGEGPEVTEVDVAGRPAHLVATAGGASTSLGWPRADESIVHLIAVGVATDDLRAAGGAIEGALAVGEDPPATLPGPLVLRRETPPDTSPSDQSEVSYGSGNRYVGLRITSGGTARLDGLLLDRLASSGGWRPATVAGRPAVLSTYAEAEGGGGGGENRTLMWAPSDGVVAEVVGQGLSEGEMEAAAASIHAIDDARWDDLVASSGPTAPASGEAMVVDDQVGAAVNEICQARNTWLKARTAGDQAAEAAAVADLGAVLEKGQASGLKENGLGDTGDIVVVARRLLDAMAAGDVAAVNSIPEGGACS